MRAGTWGAAVRSRPRGASPRPPSKSVRTQIVSAFVLSLVAFSSIASSDEAAGASDPLDSMGTRSEAVAHGLRDVVLLHGLGRSAANLRLLEWRLEARGYRVCNVDYESRVADLDQVVDEVVRGLADCGLAGRPAHYVTHSLGSLVVRALFARGQVARGGRAVLLAPPSTGSEIVDRLAAADWLTAVLGPLAAQLGTAPGSLPQRLPPPPIPFGVVAGDRWINPLGALWLPGPHDGTVSVARTRLPAMCDHLVMPYTHTFIVAAAPVAEQVDAFLQTGRFRRDPDTARALAESPRAHRGEPRLEREPRTGSGSGPRAPNCPD